MKKITGISVLIFFLVFVASADRCLNKNDCARNKEGSEITAIRDIFSQRRVERESRVVNIRGRVGSERLVNNRRIVDSDSRLSNFPARLDNARREDNRLLNRNFDIPRTYNRLHKRVRNTEPRQITERTISGIEKVRDTERVQSSQTSQIRRHANELRMAQNGVTERTRNERERFRNSEQVRLARSSENQLERNREVPDSRRITERNNRGGEKTHNTEIVRLVRALNSVDSSRRYADTRLDRSYENTRRTRASESRISERTAPEIKEVRDSTTVQRRVAKRNIPEAERVRNSRIFENRVGETQKSFSSERTRNSNIAQDRNHERTPQRFGNNHARETRDSERENNVVRMEDTDRVRNEREMSRIAERRNQERREFEKLENRDHREFAKVDDRRNIREERLDTRDVRRDLRNQMYEDSRQYFNEQRRTTEQSRRHLLEALNDIDENNNKIYRSYLNQKDNRFDTAWSKLLTTFVGILIICQIVHSNLDSKRFCHIKNLFTATKEKVC